LLLLNTIIELKIDIVNDLLNSLFNPAFSPDKFWMAYILGRSQNDDQVSKIKQRLLSINRNETVEATIQLVEFLEKIIHNAKKNEPFDAAALAHLLFEDQKGSVNALLHFVCPYKIEQWVNSLLAYIYPKQWHYKYTLTDHPYYAIHIQPKHFIEQHLDLSKATGAAILWTYMNALPPDFLNCFPNSKNKVVMIAKELFTSEENRAYVAKYCFKFFKLFLEHDCIAESFELIKMASERKGTPTSILKRIRALRTKLPEFA
jgi:hypothetical protein